MVDHVLNKHVNVATIREPSATEEENPTEYAREELNKQVNLEQSKVGENYQEEDDQEQIEIEEKKIETLEKQLDPTKNEDLKKNEENCLIGPEHKSLYPDLFINKDKETSTNDVIGFEETKGKLDLQCIFAKTHGCGAERSEFCHHDKCPLREVNCDVSDCQAKVPIYLLNDHLDTHHCEIESSFEGDENLSNDCSLEEVDCDVTGCDAKVPIYLLNDHFVSCHAENEKETKMKKESKSKKVSLKVKKTVETAVYGLLNIFF
jgi:hypothetical protein